MPLYPIGVTQPQSRYGGQAVAPKVATIFGNVNILSNYWIQARTPFGTLHVDNSLDSAYLGPFM